MKLGLDLHGCADTHYEVYGPITQFLSAAPGHEVHIITGRQPDKEILSNLWERGIRWDKWFSIAQHHIDLDDGEVWFEDGKPWMKSALWDPAKAEYCERVGIDVHIDDSPIYGQYFTGKCLYLLQKDLRRQDAWAALARGIR